MKRDYIIKGNDVRVTEKAVDKTGNVIAVREVLIPLDQLQQETERFREWVQSTINADVSTSIEVAIDTILDNIKEARSPYEVQLLSQRLNRNIELYSESQSKGP